MFTLPSLQFETNALEPHIDEATMQIHHTKHHQAYIDNANKALEAFPDLINKEAWELLSNLTQVPEEIRVKIQNNVGGHANHSFFWKLLTPSVGVETLPDGISALITKNFGSLDEFKAKFKEAALGRFGSGWVWLILKGQDQVEIVTTPNQDTPWLTGVDAILGLDVWEHAYYLKYQNKRADYIDSFWNVLNWNQVSINLEKARGYLKTA